MAGKKGMKQRGWGTLRRLPSGRYQASYVGPDLARHTAPVTYTGEMDAQHWLYAERLLIERQEWTAPAVRKAAQTSRGISVTDYLNGWIAQRVTLTHGVRYAYKNNVRKHIAPKPLGRLPLSAVTPDAVRSWYATMDPSKPSARKAVYVMLRTIMGTATDDGIFTRNPVSVARATVEHTKKQAVILTPVEIAELADGVGEQLRAWVWIAGWCGLRFGEAMELRRGDIAPDCSVIHVTRGHTHPVGECIVGPPKNGEAGSVTVPKAMRALLKHHLDTYVEPGDDALLFAPRTKGRCHLSDDTLRRAMQPTLDRIGKPNMTIHDLRHTMALLTAESGATISELMARLRHKSSRASLIYLSAADGSAAKVADRLSSRMAEIGQKAG